MTKRYDTAYFIERAIKKHGNKFDYSLSEYVNSKANVEIICKACEFVFEATPNNHLCGTGCPKCASFSTANKQRWTADIFIKKSKNRHGDKLGYSKVEYKDVSTNVILTCLVNGHGDFSVRPNNHLKAGTGCKKCALELFGYSRSAFIGLCAKNNNGLGFLYVVACKGFGEVFYKIGITSRGVAARFNSTGDMPYDYVEHFTLEADPSYIYDLEMVLHRIQSNYRYEPNIDFGGKTECFTTIKPIERLLRKLANTEQLQLIA